MQTNVLKRTNHPIASWKRGYGTLTFTRSSRIFHREAGGIAHAAAGEGAQSVAAGRARLTVVLLVLTLVVICATSETKQDMVMGSRGLKALPCRLFTRPPTLHLGQWS